MRINIPAAVRFDSVIAGVVEALFVEPIAPLADQLGRAKRLSTLQHLVRYLVVLSPYLAAY